MPKFKGLDRNKLRDKLETVIKEALPLDNVTFAENDDFIDMRLPKKIFALKSKYKPDEIERGQYSGGLATIQQDTKNLRRSELLLEQKNLAGKKRSYTTNGASLKLHISIKDMEDQEEDKILNLVKFLILQNANPSNNLQFHFKIFKLLYPHDTKKPDNSRFVNHDQFTLYFDRYSSLGELIKLANDIHAFLKNEGMEENSGLAFSDKIIFNSYVSARCDSNTPHNQYGTYYFFDKEIDKFLKSHTHERRLADVPLCGFEVIFNKFILNHLDLLSGQDSELSSHDSEAIQAEFLKMIKDPLHYISTEHHAPIPGLKIDEKKEESEDEESLSVTAPLQPRTGSVSDEKSDSEDIYEQSDLEDENENESESDEMEIEPTLPTGKRAREDNNAEDVKQPPTKKIRIDQQSTFYSPQIKGEPDSSLKSDPPNLNKKK